MSQPSFAYVPHTGFAAFNATLATSPWSLVDTSAYNDPAKPLWNAPLLVAVKVRVSRTVQGLLVAAMGAGSARICDQTWDGCQKRLNHGIGMHLASPDHDKRDAALRLKKILLLGAGEGQTRLRYQEEVDFGRKQVALVASGQGAADVALLGLGSTMNEIAVATEALALAIGYGESVVAPHARRAKATASCVLTFGWAAEYLAWMTSQAGAGDERALAMSLLATLDELASRYPAPTRTQVPTEMAAPPPSVH